MSPLVLNFADGQVTGSGEDAVGAFTFAGTYDPGTGAVRMVKQYIGKHQVLYIGQPDGEGSIQGEWIIDRDWKGPFLFRPVIARPAADEPIEVIG
jgi:hypothetical protein